MGRVKKLKNEKIFAYFNLYTWIGLIWAAESIATMQSGLGSLQMSIFGYSRIFKFSRSGPSRPENWVFWGISPHAHKVRSNWNLPSNKFSQGQGYLENFSLSRPYTAEERTSKSRKNRYFQISSFLGFNWKIAYLYATSGHG